MRNVRRLSGFSRGTAPGGGAVSHREPPDVESITDEDCADSPELNESDVATVDYGGCSLPPFEDPHLDFSHPDDVAALSKLYRKVHGADIRASDVAVN